MVLIRLADNAVDWQVSKVGGKGRKEDGREEIVSDGGWQKSQWAISSLFAKNISGKKSVKCFQGLPIR